MTPERFELSLRIPADLRFVGTLRALAAHAARYAGCDPARCERFADAVQQAAQTSMAGAAAGTALPVVLRRADGPVECLLDGRTLTLDV